MLVSVLERRLTCTAAVVLWLLAMLAVTPVIANQPPYPVGFPTTKLLSGSANEDDCGEDIVADKAGNFIVVGGVENKGTANDWLIAKYRTSTKKLLWSRTVNGAAAPSYDTCHAVATDSQNNIFAAGETQSKADGSEMTVAAFDPNGKCLWIRTFSAGPDTYALVRDVAVDHAGNVIVAGFFLSFRGGRADEDFVVMKLNPKGKTVWTTYLYEYDGLNSSAEAVAVDSRNNVVVGGYVEEDSDRRWFLVAKLDRSTGFILPGWPQNLGQSWTEFYGSAVSVAVDKNDNVIAAGAMSFDLGGGLDYSDFVVVKWYPYGLLYPGWPQIIDGGEANSVAVDSDDNVVACGTTVLGAGECSFTVAKWGPFGEAHWLRWLGGTDEVGAATQLKIDDQNNILAVGMMVYSRTWRDLALVKLRPNGNYGWIRLLNGNSNESDFGFAVAVDCDGDVAATGEVRRADTKADIPVVFCRSH